MKNVSLSLLIYHESFKQQILIIKMLILLLYLSIFKELSTIIIKLFDMSDYYNIKLR